MNLEVESMKHILNQLFEHNQLNRTQAKEVLMRIANNDYPPSQVASFITVYLMRNISPDELEGFRDALLEMCVPFQTDSKVIDLCGTGGDGKDTFNISTLASFVVAGCGFKVAKHGNYGVSSVSGSSNVLEALGYEFVNDTGRLQRQLDEANICFMHAPLFHPALKGVASIRRELGIKTFFNMLGPLVNPTKPKYQLTGVFNLQLARAYQHIMHKSHTSYAIIHGLDGYDELSLTGDAKVISRDGEAIYSPQYFGSETLSPAAIFGGYTLQENISTFEAVIKGYGTKAQNKVVIANAAMAIKCVEPTKTILECLDMAHTSLSKGYALDTLNRLLNTQN